MAANQELRALGRARAEIQDAALSTRQHAPTSGRLAAIYQARARKVVAGQGFPLWRPLGLVAVAAAALMLLSLPLHFVVGAARAPGQLGVWVAAPVRDTTQLAFSDGSQMLLQPGAHARVLSASEHGARVVVERGMVRAEVVPRLGNDWFVIGGPFEIHVTGTSFDASWDP